MKTIALNRLNLIGTTEGVGLSPEQIIKVTGDLAQLGYRISNPEKLGQLAPAFMNELETITNFLKKKRGGDVPHVSLFKNFPENTPYDGSYLMRRMIGFIGNALNLYDQNVVLENGVEVPKWLFNVYEFGADPITQMQSPDLFRLTVKEQESKKGDKHIEWIDLKVVTEAEMIVALKGFLQKNIYSKSSIKEALREDIFQLLGFFGASQLDPAKMIFQENKALVMAFFWKKGRHEALSRLTRTATDLLRVFAAATDTDISLAEKVKFPKMNRKARKAVLATLENSANLPEELKKYERLWLEIGRYLHPTEYAQKFPKTAEVFDALRNGRIDTYNAKTERYLAQQDRESLLQHLNERPGIFGRKLHELLRKFPKQCGEIIEAFEKTADKIPLKNLLVMKRYFESINELENRTVVNKKGKMKVIPNNAIGALNTETLVRLSTLFTQLILRQLAERESWQEQKVWIDPAIGRLTVPLQQRKMSDGMLTVGRGSRMPLELDKVLRLFVYWKENGRRTDLDLSVVQLNEDFRYIGHVSYTNLRSGGIVHSGDIQSAPYGATEYIDITLDTLNPNVRYLAVEVYRYTGNHFHEMNCFAGWMIRQEMSSNRKAFDPKTVANKMALNGKGAFSVPLVVDLQEREIILADLYVPGRSWGNNVESSQGQVAMLCSEVSRFIQNKPNLKELAVYHSLARNATLVKEKEEADITFGDKDCTFDMHDVSTILSEFI